METKGNDYRDDCHTCRLNRNEEIPLGGVIYDDGMWRVEHRIDPGPILGWLIVKPIRHVEFFDELTDDEATRYGMVNKRVIAALRQALPEPPEKVYSILLAEAVDYPHLHFHVVPRPASFPREFRGPRIFGFDGPPVDVAEIDGLTNGMRERLKDNG